MDDFRFKPFQEMTEADYQAVGFRSGLEIHQQLLTEKKLFCRCPAGKYSREYNAEILRHMRPTLSELGEYDGTALMEFKTKKEIIYQISRDTVCTYEMDDTPPFFLDEQALDIALGIAVLYNLVLVDELHIARKQYLDGSIPTGFQRTTIVGVDGWIPYRGRKIRIVQLGLEEDACREVMDVGHLRVYLTDRLGMPLIETVTAPDMKTPQEVAEVAQICRRLVRSTGWVRTGIGAAREDVNVSVTGGTRVEIKGVHRIPRIPLLTYHEAMRQWNLLRLREALHSRGITPETFAGDYEEVTKILSKTRYGPIQAALEQNMVANGVVLRGFCGLLNWQTQTNTHFSKEISDRVRVVACLTNLPNIIHSDSPSDNISAFEWDAIRKALRATKDDTLVVVWGNKEDARTGAQEIIIRAREATIGIPSETRQALRDGTNGFERILPGPDRMYPDTDLPPIKVTGERIERIKRILPVPIWEREDKFMEMGLAKELSIPLAGSRLAEVFEKVAGDRKISPGLLASMLVAANKELRRKKQSVDGRLIESFEKIFSLYKSRRLSRFETWEALKMAIQNRGLGELQASGLAPAAVIEKTLSECYEEIKKLKISSLENTEKVLTGMVMDRLERKADGADILKKVRARLAGEG